MDEYILCYDGVCALCNNTVNFVYRRDVRAQFRFLALQSETARALLAPHGLDNRALQSLVLLHNGRAYQYTDAVLKTALALGGVWKIAAAGYLCPKPVRDWLYRLAAARRYRWFGARAACPIPDADFRRRLMA